MKFWVSLDQVRFQTRKSSRHAKCKRVRVVKDFRNFSFRQEKEVSVCPKFG